MDFYKKLGLPFPREHFLSRLKKLIRRSNAPIPEPGACAACGKSITIYKNYTFPKRRVLCMKCYLAYLEKQ